MNPKLNRKQFIAIILTLSALFVGTLFYISLPYTNKVRSQYSKVLEMKGDASTANKAIVLYREAEYLSPRDSLYLKIGTIYDQSGKTDLAGRSFKKIKSEEASLELANHYLKAGAPEKAAELLTRISPSTDSKYLEALTLLLDDPKKAFDKINAEPKNDDGSKNKYLQNYLAPLIDNPQKSYTDTAIALYLYKNGYDEMALNILEPYLEKDYRDALILLGEIYENKKLYNISAIAYQKAIELDKYEISTYKKLKHVYEKQGNTEKITEISDIINKLEVIPN